MSIILLRTVQIIRSHRGKNCKCAAKNEAKVSPESVRWYSASQRESIKSKHLKKREISFYGLDLITSDFSSSPNNTKKCQKITKMA